MANRFDFISNWRRSYPLVVVIGSLLITVLFILVYNAFDFKSPKFTYIVFSGIISSFVVWMGSGFISMVLMKRINIFVHPVKVISLLAASLIAYTTLVVL